MICDCNLSYQSFIIFSGFPHDEVKVLPLCTYLTIVIKTLTDLVLVHLWCFFVALCVSVSCTWVGFRKSDETSEKFLRSPPPSLIPFPLCPHLAAFPPPANGFVLLKTSMFFNILSLSQTFLGFLTMHCWKTAMHLFKQALTASNQHIVISSLTLPHMGTYHSQLSVIYT